MDFRFHASTEASRRKKTHFLVHRSFRPLGEHESKQLCKVWGTMCEGNLIKEERRTHWTRSFSPASTPDLQSIPLPEHQILKEHFEGFLF